MLTLHTKPPQQVDRRDGDEEEGRGGGGFEFELWWEANSNWLKSLPTAAADGVFARVNPNC